MSCMAPFAPFLLSQFGKTVPFVPLLQSGKGGFMDCVGGCPIQLLLCLWECDRFFNRGEESCNQASSTRPGHVGKPHLVLLVHAVKGAHFRSPRSTLRLQLASEVKDLRIIWLVKLWWIAARLVKQKWHKWTNGFMLCMFLEGHWKGQEGISLQHLQVKYILPLPMEVLLTIKANILGLTYAFVYSPFHAIKASGHHCLLWQGIPYIKLTFWIKKSFLLSVPESACCLASLNEQEKEWKKKFSIHFMLCIILYTFSKVFMNFQPVKQFTISQANYSEFPSSV